MSSRLAAPFRQSRAVQRERPETHAGSPAVEEHGLTGERGGDGRSTSSDENPAIGNPYGDGGQTESTEHRKDVNRNGIVRTLLGHRRRVSHGVEPGTRNVRIRHGVSQPNLKRPGWSWTRRRRGDSDDAPGGVGFTIAAGALPFRVPQIWQPSREWLSATPEPEMPPRWR